MKQIDSTMYITIWNSYIRLFSLSYLLSQNSVVNSSIGFEKLLKIYNSK